MRVNIDRSVRLSQLNAELNAALGFNVALAREGETLTILDASTGRPLPGDAVDAEAARQAVDSHDPADPEVGPTPAEELVEALQAATTVQALRNALVARYAPVAEKERATRAARMDIRRRKADAR